MATIAQQNDDEEQPGQPKDITGTAGAGSGGGTGATGSAPVSQVQQNQAPQNNQGYTDVASYLNANKTGSEQLGQQVAQNVTNKFNTTKGGIDTSYNQFAGDVSKGYTPENTDLIRQVAADPTASAANSDTLSQFQSQLNDKYTGPTSWGDYGTQQGKVNEANQYASLATTPGGLNVYSQEVEGQTGGPQSQGINQLDTLLLGGNADAVQNIRAATDPYKTLNDYINQQNMAGTQAITGAQTNAQQASQDALNAFTGDNGTLTGLNTQINQTAEQQQAAAIAAQQALMSDIGGLYSAPADNTATSINAYGKGQAVPWYNTTNYTVNNTLSPQDLQQLGMSQDQWNSLMGAMQQAGTSEYKTGHNFGAASPTSQIDLSQYLSSIDPNSINAGTVATKDQYDKMAAIQQLLGDKMPQGAAINPALASLAGTAPTSLNQFNYNAALDQSTSVADQERQAAQDMANYLSGQGDLSHAQGQHGGWGGFLKQAPFGIAPAAYNNFAKK